MECLYWSACQGVRFLDDICQRVGGGFAAGSVGPPAVQVVRSNSQVQQVQEVRGYGSRGAFEFWRIGTTNRFGPMVEVVTLQILGNVADGVEVQAVIPQSSRQGLLEGASRLLAT